MSTPTSTDDPLIEKLLSHLKAEGYSARIQQWYPARARCFLDYCNSNALAIEAVRSAHVERFLARQYQRFRRQHGRSPPFGRWRHRYTKFRTPDISRF